MRKLNRSHSGTGASRPPHPGATRSQADRRRDDEATICSSVVSLAHAVGATSVAEGVETADQYAALRDCGCQQAQGFLWSPAVPGADLSTVLLSSSRMAIPAATPKTAPAAEQSVHDPALRVVNLNPHPPGG